MTYLQSTITSMYSLMSKQPVRPGDLIKAASLGCQTLGKLLNDEDFKEQIKNPYGPLTKDFGTPTRMGSTWKANLVREFPDFLEEIKKLMIAQKIPSGIVEVVCQQAQEMRQPISEKHNDPTALIKMIERIHYDLCDLQHDIEDNRNDRTYLYDASNKLLKFTYMLAVLVCFTSTFFLYPDLHNFLINFASVVASTYFSLSIQPPHFPPNIPVWQANRLLFQRITIPILLSLLLISGTIITGRFTFIKIPQLILGPTTSPHSHTLSFSSVNASFYKNSAPSNGTFDRTQSSVPIFTQSFPVIAFNPDPRIQHCSNGIGVNTDTRPFTDVLENSDGSCTPISVQDASGHQAGLGDLYSFEAVFLTSINIPGKGTLTMAVRGDDGWIISIGANSNGGKPPYPVQSNIRNNPSVGNRSPMYNYPEMGDNDISSSPTLYNIKVNFSGAGNYPVEIDYTECCSEQLTLVISNIFTPEPS